MPLPLNPNIASAPLYIGGAAIEDIRAQYGVEEIIKIGSNESPIGPSPQAIAAMQQALATLNRYPPMGDDDLRAVLAETLGQGLAADHFVTGNGGCDILELIAAGFLDSEAEIIISPPTFPIYEITARKLGATVVYAPLNPVDFSYDVEAILAAKPKES
ncbi:MAG TPA: aminotransferase class I/II-fold pyridoxal phosphate-dependent enzyme [Anaerolineae bacterium]|nr:aminotransferase class I/II-fold pyridoxal phosphate-dependent enzyme [Anaerolineae bacterium]